MYYKRALSKIFLLALLISACNTADKSAVDTSAGTPKANNKKAKTILFFGDSLTAGYGLEDLSEAFPALTQEKIDSLQLDYKVINAGVSGETTAGGAGRIDWTLKQPIDVFVLELGANDGLRGIPVAETSKNLQEIVDKVKAKYPQAKLVLAGMMVPPNMGADYATSFKEIFPAIAKKNGMAFMPFLLEGVGGIRKLNQGDGIHPTAEGHKIIANNFWPILQPLL